MMDILPVTQPEPKETSMWDLFCSNGAMKATIHSHRY